MPSINYVMDLEEEIRNLREKIKQLNDDNTALQHTVDDFVVKCKDLQSAYDKEHSRWVELAENYDRLETKYRRLERENEDLKAKKDNVLAFYRIKQLEETNERLKSQLMETNDTLEKANRDRNDLLREFDAAKKDLKQQNKKLGEKCQEEIKARENWKQTCYKRGERICSLMREKEDLHRQIDILKQRDAVFVDLDSVKIKGMEELWAMLGTMYAADPIEVSKIFGWFSINNIAHYTPDIRDFLKKYEAWKGCAEEKEAEKKRLADMRNYLHKFCQGHICLGCPLEAEEYKCGHIDFFKEMIPDKDLQRYYDKAVEEKPSDEEVPCSFSWKLDGTEFTIETSIPKEEYDNIVKIISGKE